MTSSQEMLEEYKKYDFLNKGQTPLIKILVSYIKPTTLFKSDILVPIHLGRSVEKEQSKDGVQSDENLVWLHKNCIGDNDFEENISHTNRRVGFLTGTYWAWKNYDKLGNPAYFGSFGYRRLFKPDFLEKLTDYDLVLPHKKDLSPLTLERQMSFYHGKKLYNLLLEVFDKIYPQEISSLQQYLSRKEGYFDEIYVMKKEVFFAFCEWIFPLLFACLEHDPIELPDADLRDIGFIIERITGYYCNKVKKSLRVLEAQTCITENLEVNKKISIFSLLRFHVKNDE